MVARALWGLGGGGTVGALWGVFGRCLKGTCAMEWNPWVPTAVGALAGLGLVLASRWD